MQNSAEGWNFFFTGYGTNSSLGGIAAIRFHADPSAFHKPKDNSAFMKLFNEIANGKTLDVRKAAFAKAQQNMLEDVVAIPFGTLTKVQAVRSNVENFRPFRIPRVSNVWIKG